MQGLLGEQGVLLSASLSASEVCVTLYKGTICTADSHLQVPCMLYSNHSFKYIFHKANNFLSVWFLDQNLLEWYIYYSEVIIWAEDVLQCASCYYRPDFLSGIPPC